MASNVDLVDVEHQMFFYSYMEQIVVTRPARSTVDEI